MGESDTLATGIARMKETLAVGPAVRELAVHPRQRYPIDRLAVEVDYSRDSAHGFSTTRRMSKPARKGCDARRRPRIKHGRYEHDVN